MANHVPINAEIIGANDHESHYVFDILFNEEWENMQRIMVSLALKTTTQSTIVRKLSAFARKNKTWRALWEYDNISRSLYLLDYGEMRRVAAYLDIPVNAALWPTLVQAVTFTAMKANAEKMAPAATIGLWKDTANFFHQGTTRRWKGVLTGEQIARYRGRAVERLELQLARWLEHGRRVAGDPR